MGTKRYQVIDNHTGKHMGKPCRNIRTAICKVDRLDNEYGACRYSYFAIHLPTLASEVTK